MNYFTLTLRPLLIKTIFWFVQSNLRNKYIETDEVIFK